MRCPNRLRHLELEKRFAATLPVLPLHLAGRGEAGVASKRAPRVSGDTLKTPPLLRFRRRGGKREVADIGPKKLWKNFRRTDAPDKG